MRKLLALITILALLLVGCGDDDTGGDTTTTSLATTVTTTETTTTEPPAATCRRAPGDQPFEEVADGLDDILVYQPGRYRVDQVDPITHFTIDDEWGISDLVWGSSDDPSGFSGLRPEALAAEEAEDPFVEIWPITAWCDVATDTNVVLAPGELAPRIEADPRLADVERSEVTVGSCPATRIDAQVLDEYQDGNFWLGMNYPRSYGDISQCEGGNTISAAGDAAEHVVFWAIDVDGIDLLVNATYPTELADQFEPMLDAFVASIEFE